MDGTKLAPMLCSQTGAPDHGEEWIYELKLDGVREIATKRGHEVILTTRNQRQNTSRYPEVERAVEMRKHLAAARGLPAQPLSKPHRIDVEQDEIALPGEISGQGAGHLKPSRKMDETVAGIVGGALEAVGRAITGTPIRLAAQNLHWEPKGAFTGAVAAAMLRDAGCAAVIIGISEWRQYFA